MLVLKKTRERLREETFARYTAAPLTDDEVASILDSVSQRPPAVSLDGPLAKVMFSRHPMRMKRLRSELTWLAMEAGRLGIDVKIELP